MKNYQIYGQPIVEGTFVEISRTGKPKPVFFWL